MARKAAVVRGHIDLPEVSGAKLLPGDQLLLVSDDRGLFLCRSARKQLLKGRVRPDCCVAPGAPDDPLELDDLEDAAFDSGRGRVYLLTSHSRNRRGRGLQPRADDEVTKPERFRLAAFDLTGENEVGRWLWTDALARGGASIPLLASAMERSAAQCGLNMEGLSFMPGDPSGTLAIGLRAPTWTSPEPREDKMQEHALLLMLTNADALLEGRHKNPRWLRPSEAGAGGPLWALPLAGQGIRGLCWDGNREGFWILSGLSSDPNHPVPGAPWNLWFWRREHEPEKVDPPGAGWLTSPEAICLLELDGTSYLLLAEDRKPASPYLLLPVACIR